MSGFDHMGFSVGDLDKSLAFYDAALAPVGLAVREEMVGKRKWTVNSGQ